MHTKHPTLYINTRMQPSSQSDWSHSSDYSLLLQPSSASVCFPSFSSLGWKRRSWFLQLAPSLGSHSLLFFYLSFYALRFNPVSHSRYTGSCSLCLTLFQSDIPLGDPMDSVACTYTHTHTHTHTGKECRRDRQGGGWAAAVGGGHMHTNLQTHTHTHVYILYIYIYLYIHIYTRVCVCSHQTEWHE